MAMDNFLEEVATKHGRGAQSFLYMIANVLMVVFAVIGFAMIQSLLFIISNGAGVTEIIFNVVGIVIFGGSATLLFLRRDHIRCEYEYTFTNGTLDFAQVFNNKKRKNLGTMNVRNVEACGLVSSGSFNRYLTMQGVKRNNWFINRDAQLFYFYFSKDNVKRLIVIEPSEEMIKLIRHYSAQGAYQQN